MVNHGQSTTWWSPFLSRSNTWLLSSLWNPSAHLALLTMKTFAQWCRIDTSYFTYNWETCGGWECLIPSCTGPKDLPTALPGTHYFLSSSKLKITNWLKINIIWMTSPICQLTIFAIRQWIYLKASIWKTIMHCMHSLPLFSWPILSQNCHIYGHNLQMTGPKSLKLHVIAL